MVEPVADSSESLADEPRPTVEPVASEAAQRVADLQRQEQTLRQEIANLQASLQVV